MTGCCNYPLGINAAGSSCSRGIKLHLARLGPDISSGSVLKPRVRVEQGFHRHLCCFDGKLLFSARQILWEDSRVTIGSRISFKWIGEAMIGQWRFKLACALAAFNSRRVPSSGIEFGPNLRIEHRH